VRLPTFGQAVVEISKLRDYVSIPLIRVDAIRLVCSLPALDITQADAELLRQQLLDAVTAKDAIPGETDQ
jgi:hypothetical protein